MIRSVITGVGVALPAADTKSWLLGGYELAEGFDPLDGLDRRKLRYKNRATILALQAVRQALDDAGLAYAPRLVEGFERTGVVAASNFGNVETICHAIDAIDAGGSRDVSPLELPNASPNVISASIAIYFGAGAVNLMLMGGDQVGYEALRAADGAIRAGRADRMIVVGTENFSAPLAALLSPDCSGLDARSEGAAAIVMEADRGQGGAIFSATLLEGLSEPAPAVAWGAHWPLVALGQHCVGQGLSRS